MKAMINHFSNPGRIAIIRTSLCRDLAFVGTDLANTKRTTEYGLRSIFLYSWLARNPNLRIDRDET